MGSWYSIFFLPLTNDEERIRRHQFAVILALFYQKLHKPIASIQFHPPPFSPKIKKESPLFTRTPVYQSFACKTSTIKPKYVYTGCSGKHTCLTLPSMNFCVSIFVWIFLYVYTVSFAFGLSVKKLFCAYVSHFFCIL